LPCDIKLLQQKYGNFYFVFIFTNYFYQTQTLQEFEREEVVVSGDRRCDSPGKCAKFCTYTLMEPTKNLILHSETVDKREVQNKSPNMEREAIDRALEVLKERVNVVEVTTDSSTSVTKMMGTYVS